MPHHNVHLPALVKEGEVVTFSYEISARRELPVNPIVSKIRRDVTWEDVLKSHFIDLKMKQLSAGLLIVKLNTYYLFVIDTSNVQGCASHSQDWTIGNMRLYLMSLAAKFNLDPLVPDTWYQFPARSLYQSKVR